MRKITFLILCTLFCTIGLSQTFSGGTGAIPDDNCDATNEFTVTVSGVGTLGPTLVLDQIDLDITHTWDSDLDVTLIAPDGTTLIDVTSDNGGSGDNYTGTVFRDDAVTPITGGSAPFDMGPYNPEQPLTTFNGVDADGDWILQVCDDAGGDTGTLNSWSLTFAAPPACPNPTVLTATNITDTSADLGWTENGSATAWDLEIGADGFTPTGTATNAGVGNPYTAMGLTENTAYDYYVRADCGSSWVGPFSFNTLETCPTPSSLGASNIMETSADLDWTENGSATSWNIEIVDLTAGGTATGTPTASGVSNPYSATGLVGDNNYEFYVQADCGVDGVSSWAGPFSFSTPYVAVAPDCTNGTFLDSGGMSGNYSSSESITYTICPDNMGDAVTVDFLSFSIENNGATGCWDSLTIHDGADTSAPTIDSPNGPGWCWDRNDATPQGSGDLQGMMITSSDASGCLTFVFNSDSSVTRDGWVANVQCNPLSTDEFENQAAFTYYPNPVKNTLTLNAQNTIENVTMYNMLGQEVLSANPNSVDSDIDMSNLANGSYFVKVTIANITETIRVIKQ